MEVAVKGASTTIECEGDTIVNDSIKLHGVKVVPDLQFIEKDRARIWNDTIGQAVKAK